MAKKTVKERKWRDACRNEMKKATIKEARARTAKKKPPFNYRWEHVKAVVKQAQKLAKKTGGDPQVAVAAAWLHDVKKFEEGPRHAEKGAQFAKEFLSKTDFPAEKIDAVAQAISAHTGLWRDKPLENLNDQILWDADKLTKIGLTAAFHWMPNDMVRPHTAHTVSNILKKGRENKWQEKTVASFHTEPAKKAGAARLKALRKLWKQLEQELRGNDL